ncbi:MAG: membrane protein insertion efficiency factor YidD [Spirochaetota bacterium]
MLTSLSIYLIRLYQRFISPYKGFRCAHAAYHRGHSCSQAVIAILTKHGLWNGLSKIHLRFKHCKYAYHRIVASRKNKTKQFLAKIAHKPKSISIAEIYAKKTEEKKERECSCEDMWDAVECSADAYDCADALDCTSSTAELASGAGECMEGATGACECAGAIGSCSP